MARSIESQMFEVVTSMVTSCPVILDEPPIMAVVRIMTGADRLIGVLQDHSLADDFLAEARSEWLRNYTTMMSDPQYFTVWLDQFSARFVLEAKRRNLEQMESGSATTSGRFPALGETHDPDASMVRHSVSQPRQPGSGAVGRQVEVDAAVGQPRT